MIKLIIIAIIVPCLLLTGIMPPGMVHAAVLTAAPMPGLGVAAGPAYTPPLLGGIKVHAEDPLRLEFLLDQGDVPLEEAMARRESARLVRYFLAGLTIAGKDLWVNLSPYEKDRIISPSLGRTAMGRDLLAQDCRLKQMAASLLSPDTEAGRAFWQEVYARAGQADIPRNALTKVWIVPDEAVVYEQGQTALVRRARLKVLLKEDYGSPGRMDSAAGPGQTVSDALRRAVVPVLEREVNEGRTFAPLRQVYRSLVLACWYKQKIRSSLLARVYVDQAKSSGMTIDGEREAVRLWGRYMALFRKGAVDEVREETDPVTGDIVPRRYTAGGVTLDAAQVLQVSADAAARPDITTDRGLLRVEVALRPERDVSRGVSDRAQKNRGEAANTLGDIILGYDALWRRGNAHVRDWVLEELLNADVPQAYAALMDLLNNTSEVLPKDRERIVSHLAGVYEEPIRQFRDAVLGHVSGQEARRELETFFIDHGARLYLGTASPAIVSAGLPDGVAVAVAELYRQRGLAGLALLLRLKASSDIDLLRGGDVPTLAAALAGEAGVAGDVEIRFGRNRITLLPEGALLARKVVPREELPAEWAGARELAGLFPQGLVREAALVDREGRVVDDINTAVGVSYRTGWDIFRMPAHERPDLLSIEGRRAVLQASLAQSVARMRQLMDRGYVQTQVSLLSHHNMFTNDVSYRDAFEFWGVDLLRAEDFPPDLSPEMLWDKMAYRGVRAQEASALDNINKALSSEWMAYRFREFVQPGEWALFNNATAVTENTLQRANLLLLQRAFPEIFRRLYRAPRSIADHLDWLGTRDAEIRQVGYGLSAHNNVRGDGDIVDGGSIRPLLSLRREEVVMPLLELVLVYMAGGINNGLFDEEVAGMVSAGLGIDGEDISRESWNALLAAARSMRTADMLDVSEYKELVRMLEGLFAAYLPATIGVPLGEMEADVPGADAAAQSGGVDLGAAERVLQVDGPGGGMVGGMGPGYPGRWEAVPGFVPVVLRVVPLRDPAVFLN